MRCKTCGVLAALAALLTLVEPGAAHELAGTWVPEGLTPEILTRQPQKVRVLVIREAPGGLIGKVVIPALAGVPVAVEQHGDRVRLTMQMARGMETPLDATLTADHLSIAAPDGTPPSALRRASEDERQVLERLAPAKLPIPAMKALPANGLARTPPMGFSTWNHFQTAIDDRTISKHRRGVGDDRHA